MNKIIIVILVLFLVLSTIVFAEKENKQKKDKCENIICAFPGFSKYKKCCNPIWKENKKECEQKK